MSTLLSPPVRYGAISSIDSTSWARFKGRHTLARNLVTSGMPEQSDCPRDVHSNLTPSQLPCSPTLISTCPSAKLQYVTYQSRHVIPSTACSTPTELRQRGGSMGGDPQWLYSDPWAPRAGALCHVEVAKCHHVPRFSRNCLCWLRPTCSAKEWRGTGSWRPHAGAQKDTAFSGEWCCPSSLHSTHSCQAFKCLEVGELLPKQLSVEFCRKAWASIGKVSRNCNCS